MAKWQSWFIEETLSTGEKITIPFDSEEEMINYKKKEITQ